MPGAGIGLPAQDKLVTTEKSRETEEILNCILPPREWEENGQLWRQQVSWCLNSVN